MGERPRKALFPLAGVESPYIGAGGLVQWKGAGRKGMDLGVLVPNSTSVANATANFNLMVAHAESSRRSYGLKSRHPRRADRTQNHRSFADNPKRDRPTAGSRVSSNDASRSVRACPAACWRGQFQSETRSRIMHGPLESVSYTHLTLPTKRIV